MVSWRAGRLLLRTGMGDTRASRIGLRPPRSCSRQSARPACSRRKKLAEEAGRRGRPLPVEDHGAGDMDGPDSGNGRKRTESPAGDSAAMLATGRGVGKYGGDARGDAFPYRVHRDSGDRDHRGASAGPGGRGREGGALLPLAPLWRNRQGQALPLQHTHLPRLHPGCPGDRHRKPDRGGHRQDPGGGEVRPGAPAGRTQGGHPFQGLPLQAGVLPAEDPRPSPSEGIAEPSARGLRRELAAAGLGDGGGRALHAGLEPQEHRGPGGQGPGQERALRHPALRLRHPDPGRRVPVLEAQGASPRRGPDRLPEAVRQRIPAAEGDPAGASLAPEAGGHDLHHQELGRHHAAARGDSAVPTRRRRSWSACTAPSTSRTCSPAPGRSWRRSGEAGWRPSAGSPSRRASSAA